MARRRSISSNSGAHLTSKDIPGRVWARIFRQTEWHGGLAYWLGSCTNSGYPQVCWVEGGVKYNVLLHHLFAKIFLNEDEPINTRTHRVHHLDDTLGKRCFDPRNLAILTRQEHADIHAAMRRQAAAALGLSRMQ